MRCSLTSLDEKTDSKKVSRTKSSSACPGLPWQPGSKMASPCVSPLLKPKDQHCLLTSCDLSKCSCCRIYCACVPRVQGPACIVKNIEQSLLPAASEIPPSLSLLSLYQPHSLHFHSPLLSSSGLGQNSLLRSENLEGYLHPHGF